MMYFLVVKTLKTLLQAYKDMLGSEFEGRVRTREMIFAEDPIIQETERVLTLVKLY